MKRIKCERCGRYKDEHYLLDSVLVIENDGGLGKFCKEFIYGGAEYS